MAARRRQALDSSDRAFFVSHDCHNACVYVLPHRRGQRGMAMKHTHSTISFSSVLVAGLLIAGSAMGADGDKTYAAFGGNDGNNCFTPPTACQSLQRAIDQTNSGGTVILDPPLYNAGTALINKPLIINFNGNQSDSPLVGTPASNLIINTANGNDMVIVDNLHMNLLGANRNGIQINRGSFTIRNSLIQNVGGSNRSGILFTPNANGQLFIFNSTIADAPFGLTVDGRSGADIIAVLDDTIFIKNGTGIRSVPGAGSNHDVVLRDSVLSGNTIGVQSSTNRSDVRIKNSTITGNTTGLSRPGGGQITSLTGNSVTANTTNGTFTGTVNPQ
jgi:hypothetical protein